MKKALIFVGATLILGALIFIGLVAYGMKLTKEAEEAYAKERAKIEAEDKEKEKKRDAFNKRIREITENDIINHKLRDGMSMRDVERSIGYPNSKKSELMDNGGRMEFWVYNGTIVTFANINKGEDLEVFQCPEIFKSSVPFPSELYLEMLNQYLTKSPKDTSSSPH